MARKQPKELSDAEFDVAIQADLDARLVPRPRTYTEAELQSAVAGAYRDMSARIRESADADTKWNRISVGTQNLLHYIADGIDKRTPASAQKAFADAVAAETAELRKMLSWAAEFVPSDLRYAPYLAIIRAALTPTAGGETRGK